MSKITQERLQEIRERIAEATEMVKEGVSVVDGELKIELNFDDEFDLTEQWMLMLADCKVLIDYIDQEKPNA